MKTITVVALATLASGAAAQQSAPRWPREIQVEQGSLVVYQPQLEKLDGVTLSGRSAVSWTAKAGGAPVFGVFWFDARVLVDKDRRQMEVEEVTVTKVRFPNVKPEQEQAVAKLIETEIPKWDVNASLDEVQAALAVTERERASEKGLSVAPPKLVFSNDPAVLLPYDGEPALRPLEQTGLERAVNTPLFVVRDPAEKKLYLAGGTFWFEATDPKGPWKPTATPSAAVKAVYDKNPPPPPPAPEPDGVTTGAGTPPPKPAAAPETPPRIVVATEPTELVVFDGKPSWAPVGKDGNLLYADNTDGRVLVHVPTSETFVLVSGRWYRAASFAGPWTPVRPDKLPAPFRSIPPESPIADVRAFVSGTSEAADALADTQIPQTTAVKRDQKLEVTYDGEPKFKQIEGTKLAYAVNTPFSVLQDSGQYWCCHQAVWYVAPTPKGPWTVSDKRPPSIDQVPPTAPVYNTKYVYVYQSTPEVVYVGYLPGYVGVYPYYGTVVYGTGFYYPPYIGPVYAYPRPATFGVHVSYSPWAGWGVGVSYGTPFFSVGIHFGGYGGYYGPHGYHHHHPPHYGYRPPPPGYRPPAGHYPGYGRPPAGGTVRPTPGGGAVVRNPSTMPANNNIYNRPENTSRNATRQASAQDRRAPSVSTQPNNVYGDRSGNVYRQNDGGGWDRNTSGGWQQAGGTPRQQPAQGGGQAGGGAGTRPQPTQYGGGAPANLNRDAAARSRGSYGGGGGGGRMGGGGGRGGGGRR
jgi:hypothetical protein